MSFKNVNRLLAPHNCQIRWRDAKKQKITVFREQGTGDNHRSLSIGVFKTNEIHTGLADPTMRRPDGLGGHGKTGWEDHSYTGNGFDYTTPTFTADELQQINDALMLDKLSWK